MSLQFWRTKDFSDESLLDLVSRTFGVTFTNVTDARTWLSNNGYFTSYPDIVTDGLVINLDAQNKNSLMYTERLYDYSIWADGQTGGIGQFNTYSSYNRRVVDTDPWGNDVVMWESYTVNGSTSGGGIYMVAQSIDNTKTYRMSWWENRVTNDTTTYARYYAGLHGYGTVNGVKSLSSDTPNTNPYFWNTQYDGLTENQWYLVVGHVHPPTYSGSIHEDSGRWLVNGTKIGNISSDYRWLPETTTARSRTLTIYNASTPSVTDGVRHHSCYPRLDVCDGTEPSLDDLLNNRTDTIYDLSSNSNSGVFINGPTFDDSVSALVFNATDKRIHIENNLSAMPNTYEAWIKIPSTVADGTRVGCIIGNYPTSPSVNFEYHQLGKPRFYWNNGEIDWIISGIDIRTNTWTHVTFVRDTVAGKIFYYQNGIELDSYTGSGTNISSLSGWRIGDDSTSPRIPLDGEIASIKLYSTALTPTEVLNNFNGTKIRYGL